MTAPTADGLPPAARTAKRARGAATDRPLVMLPIAVMPAAGVLLRLGSDDILGEPASGRRGPGSTASTWRA
jgi:hypothetical protein